jgi:phosphonate transport system substrate-binding protein
MLVGIRVAGVLSYRPAGSRSVRCGWVNLEEPARSAPPGESRPAGKAFFKVVLTPVLSAGSLPRQFSRFVTYLATRLDREPVLLHLLPYSEVNSLLRHQRCDLALVCSSPFVRGEREYGLEPLAVPQVAGTTTYCSLVLVPSSSKAESLLDLRNGRFVSADLVSTSGWVFPALWLRRNGQDPRRFFAEHVVTASHEQAVQAVASGAADGAAVNSLVYDHLVRQDPSIALRTRIVLKSPPFGNPVLVVHPKMDPTLKGRLLAMLLRMHEDPHGRSALASTGIDRFLAVSPAHFSTVKQTIRDWEALR